MVLADQQGVVLPVPPHEHGAQQRAPRQVEGARALLQGEPPQLAVAVRLRQAAQLHQGERHGPRRGDHLHRLALRGAEDGAQSLVAADHLAEGAPQRPGVHPAAQPEEVGEVVGGIAGLQLVQEPEPLLGEGQRRGAAAGPRPHLAAVGAGARLLQEELLEGGAALGGELRETIRDAAHRAPSAAADGDGARDGW